MARYRKEVPQSKDHNLAVQTSKNAEEEENWSEENDEEDSKDVSETGEDDKKTDESEDGGKDTDEDVAAEGLVFTSDGEISVTEPLESNDDKLQNKKKIYQTSNPQSDQISRRIVNLTVSTDTRSKRPEKNNSSSSAEAEKKKFPASEEVYKKKASASAEEKTKQNSSNVETILEKDDRKQAAFNTKRKHHKDGNENKAKRNKPEIDPFEQLIHIGTKKQSEIAQNLHGPEKGCNIEYLIAQARDSDKKRFGRYKKERILTDEQQTSLGSFALYIKQIKKNWETYSESNDKKVINESPIWKNNEETRNTLRSIQLANILLIDHARYELQKDNEIDDNLELLSVYMSKSENRML